MSDLLPSWKRESRNGCQSAANARQAALVRPRIENPHDLEDRGAPGLARLPIHGLVDERPAETQAQSLPLGEVGGEKAPEEACRA
jgi:hypothetical protein